MAFLHGITSWHSFMGCLHGIPSLHSFKGQFLHYRVNFFTAESISLPQSRFLYCRVNFFTTESISLLQNHTRASASLLEALVPQETPHEVPRTNTPDEKLEDVDFWSLPGDTLRAPTSAPRELDALADVGSSYCMGRKTVLQVSFRLVGLILFPTLLGIRGG